MILFNLGLTEIMKFITPPQLPIRFALGTGSPLEGRERNPNDSQE